MHTGSTKNRQTHYATAMIQLPLIREAGPDRCRTPEDIAHFCSDLQDLAQEAFHVMTLDSKNFIISRHMITLGLVDASLVHPREVFRAAIMDNAAAMVLVHNHPSGDSSPSAEDIRITKQLVGAGGIVGIKVLDHVIVGRPNSRAGGQKPFFSMREEGICDFG